MADLRIDSSTRKIRRILRPVLGALAVIALVASVHAQEMPSGPALSAEAGPAPTTSLAATTQPVMVVDVKISGNKTLPLDKILPHIRTRAGRPFDMDVIKEDVRRLDRTHLFVNVRTYHQSVPGGKIVIFDVVERPLLREVLFVGCSEIKKKTLQKEIDIKAGDPADPYAIEEGRRKLEELYHKKGFSAARITMLEGDKPDDRRAIFLINEGTKQKVWKVQFVGNTIADGSRLETQIKSKPPFLYLFKGELDSKELDEDIQRLTAYYRGLGFFRARIGREVEFNEKQNWATITFVVDEGPRYKINDVTVLGNSKFSSDELMTELNLKKDEYFNQSKMNADLTSLQDKYGGIGYVFADVKADPRFLAEDAKLDLVYNIKEGDRYRVGKIDVHIKGEYPHTKITTILNRLSFKPGDIVDIREIRASERRIKYSQLFENNPASGSAPKIVFSPPGSEKMDDEPENPRKTTVADRRKAERRPGGRPGGGINGGMGGGGINGGSSPNSGNDEGSATFRGQSPDPVPEDRPLTITLDCGKYIGPMDEDEGIRQDPAPAAKVEQRAMTPLPVRYAVQTSPAPKDDLLGMAGDFAASLEQAKSQPQSRDRLIQTQYTTTNQYGPGGQNGQLRWTSGAATTQPQAGAQAQPQYQAQGQYAQTNNPATQAQPAPTSPAYGQDNWPTPNVPEKPVQGPNGPYVPGPIFGPGSPFRGGPPDGSETPAALPFDINAEEAMTGRLMFGVGVNSDAGLVGSVVLDEQNFDWTRVPTSWEEIRNATAWRGGGQRFRMEAAPGTQVQRYMVDFMEPYLFDTQVSLGLSGYYYSRFYTEYTDQRLGGRAAFGYQFSPDLTGTIAYRGARINISNPIDPALPALAEVIGRDLALHGFQASLTHDKRDNAFMATEGHLIQASFEQVLGSFQYPHAELDMRKYFTLYERPDGSGRQVLSLGCRAGWTGDNTPIYERYYAGGFSTIRGFQFRGASPTEIGPTTGNPIFVGGNFELFASAEYLFPITADDMLRGVVFCDSGTVEPTADDWSNKYRIAPGFGLRIVVPAMGPAPIALDFAFPISWNPGDKSEMFSFFMGFNR